MNIIDFQQICSLLPISELFLNDGEIVILNFPNNKKRSLSATISRYKRKTQLPIKIAFDAHGVGSVLLTLGKLSTSPVINRMSELRRTIHLLKVGESAKFGRGTNAKNTIWPFPHPHSFDKGMYLERKLGKRFELTYSPTHVTVTRAK